MTENVVLAQMDCNGELFYIYWLNNEFNIEKLKDSYIVVKGNLTNVKIKKPTYKGNSSTYVITAIGVKGMERYDF